MDERYYAIRFDHRARIGNQWKVRLVASDWYPREQTLGTFATPQEGFECADRALVCRKLRLGRPRYTLNEPEKEDKYIVEEATKLFLITMPRVTAYTGISPIYWFMVQDQYDDLTNELVVIKETTTAATEEDLGKYLFNFAALVCLTGHAHRVTFYCACSACCACCACCAGFLLHWFV